MSELSLFRSVGLSGAETVTLLNNTINQDYVYVVGVEDFRFTNGSNGNLFLESGVAVDITNGEKTINVKMVADSVTFGEE